MYHLHIQEQFLFELYLFLWDEDIAEFVKVHDDIVSVDHKQNNLSNFLHDHLYTYLRILTRL